MNEVLQFTIPVNGHISIENREIIDHILANFATFCHSQKDKQACVRSQVNTFRGKSPETDIVTNIPFVALARYLPKTNHFESVFNDVERVMFFNQDDNKYTGFLLATYDVVKIENHPDLSSYDVAKYGSFLHATKQIKAPLIWLELICVREDKRGANIAKELIHSLKTDVINKFFSNDETEYIVIGIDISGTKNSWMNKSLADFYEKLGFKMSIDSGFDLYTSGGQIGYLQIKKSDISML